MSSHRRLQGFQKATVDFVLDKLEDRATYAVADEVGLGKTRVVAEIGFQLALKRPYDKQQIIFYIAPSFELIDQNLKAIDKYIKARCKDEGEQFVVKQFTSRLSRIEYDLAKHTESDQRHLFIVGLSPLTSFRVRGKGSLSEREVLAAQLSYGRWADTQNAIENAFWNLEQDVCDEYRERVAKFRTSGELGDPRKLQSSHEINAILEDLLACDPHSKIGRREIRGRLGKVRTAVVNEWLNQRRLCTLLILDEWHKYKNTCFSEPLLKRFVDKIRNNSVSKMLMVSATPFSVHFEDSEQGTHKRHQDDFRSLFELYYGRDDYEPKYDEFIRIQDKFLAAVDAFVQAGDDREEKLSSAREAKTIYENLLLEISVRTERPTEPIENMARTVDLGPRPDWGEVKRSLSEFLKSMGTINTGSPITQMWLDGHHFSADPHYAIGKHESVANLSGEHWKLSRLREAVQSEYGQDRLHTAKAPPLWLTPELDVEKHLVFTEYKFLPSEIASGLKYGPVANTAEYQGSALGYFPLKLKSAKRRSDDPKTIQRSIHWIQFYPWIAFENGLVRSLSIEQFENLVDHSEGLVDAVFNIEMHFCGHEPVKLARLNERKRLMMKGRSAQLSREAKRYLRQMFVKVRTLSQAPGAMLARAASSVHPTEDCEHHLLGIGNALLKLFAGPEATILMRKRDVRIVGRRANEHVEFAFWYSLRYKLEGVLYEYFQLIGTNASSPKEIFAEASSAIGLKRSKATNSRYARPFQDKKESAAEDDSDDSDEGFSPKSLRNAFNSPFPPYVLVSTSVGQEGLDFHRYCDRVVHWSPPSSPSVMQQREGRVDRFRSLQNRKALKRNDGSWREDELGLSPEFVVLDEAGNRLNQTLRFVLLLPYSAHAVRWKRCIQRMYYNDLLIGVPDPIAEEKRFESLLVGLSEDAKKARLEAFRSCCVSLRPRKLKSTIKRTG